MDESSFDIDSEKLAETSRRFPSRRRSRPTPRPHSDVSYLDAAPGAEFGRHAWDEAGHL